MATGLENFRIYNLAEDLEIEVHEMTKCFPKDEIFRSVDQLRRSSSSVSNNIAKGEAEETKRGMLKSARKKFISEDDAIRIADRYTILLKGTSAYIRFLNLNELKLSNHTNKYTES